MKVDDYSRYLESVNAIAAEAGKRILEVYDRGFEVNNKSDGSPLTQADSAANEIIMERLARLTPDIPVLSEESAAVAYEERSRWHTFWLVDPLDGTKEFINRNGEFTVNIALIHERRPVLGVVHVPVTGVTYSGSLNGGAFKQATGNGAQRIHASAWRGGKAVVVASRSHRGEKLDEFLARLEQREGGFETASMGSSLKLCLVAEGAADVYPRLGPTSEWDTAAAQCVVEAAGGHVTDLAGEPLRYNKTSILNPWFLVSGSGGYEWAPLIKDLSQ